MKNKLIPKHLKAGKILINEPVSESTYVLQRPLNIQELELLNYLLSNPTAEQEYFRNLAIKNMTTPQSNLGVIQTKEKEDIIDKAILGYNNFRYSHPWAEGLNYTPIIGDGMDLISLAGDVNNENYINAGLGLGMLALPNFILKPLQKYKFGKTYTNNLIKLLGDTKQNGKIESYRTRDTEDFEKYLKTLGVKTSKFSNKDLRQLQKLRKQSILDNLPEGKIVLVESEPDFIRYSLYNNKERIGILDTKVDKKNRLHADMIQKTTSDKNGVSRFLYDAALNYNKYNKTKGLISGELLLSPEQTLHVWNKYYPKRKLLSNKGEHRYNTGRYVNKSGDIFHDKNGSIVDLNIPSSNILIKSANMFHPDQIDAEIFNLKQIDLNNNNPYYKQGGTIKFNPFNKFRI